jgi:sigma-E factor negative regulatory protein RseA
MTDPVQEQLSACLDNELPEAELDLLLKRLERDPQLGEPMGRYAVIREALRDERPARASADFASRVSAAIAAEQAVSRRPARVAANSLKWLRPAVGMAIAAGVAAVAVVTVQPRMEEPQSQQFADAQPTTTAVPEVPAVQSDDRYIVPTIKASTAFIPATRLTNYVVAHSEYATPLGRRMVLNGVLAEDDTLTDETAGPASDSPVDISIQQP